MDKNLAWLTQKIEQSKSNKGNLTFPSHTVNIIELQGNKKVTTPAFPHHPPPPLQVYPPFLTKNFVPPSKWLNFGKVLSPPFISGEGGVQLWFIQCNTDSCCEHMTGGVNIHLYGCVSRLVPECPVYLCVYVCETHSKFVLVLRYQGSTFIDP